VLSFLGVGRNDSLSPSRVATRGFPWSNYSYSKIFSNVMNMNMISSVEWISSNMSLNGLNMWLNPERIFSVSTMFSTMIHMEVSWSFLKCEVPHFIIHLNGIFHSKPANKWGIPHDYHSLWKPATSQDNWPSKIPFSQALIAALYVTKFLRDEQCPRCGQGSVGMWKHQD